MANARVLFQSHHTIDFDRENQEKFFKSRSALIKPDMHPEIHQPSNSVAYYQNPNPNSCISITKDGVLRGTREKYSHARHIG
jgi:hypothetical protein